jgi:hypothetical protein
MKLLYVVMAFAASLSITSLEFDPTPSETLSFAEVGRDCSKVATNTPAGQYFQSPERPYNVSMGATQGTRAITALLDLGVDLQSCKVSQGKASQLLETDDTRTVRLVSSPPSPHWRGNRYKVRLSLSCPFALAYSKI